MWHPCVPLQSFIALHHPVQDACLSVSTPVGKSTQILTQPKYQIAFFLLGFMFTKSFYSLYLSPARLSSHQSLLTVNCSSSTITPYPAMGIYKHCLSHLHQVKDANFIYLLLNFYVTHLTDTGNLGKDNTPKACLSVLFVNTDKKQSVIGNLPSLPKILVNDFYPFSSLAF